jgi:D-lactate dehydrogenase
MKVIIFSVKEDGYKDFENANKKLKYQLTFCSQVLSKNNLHLCKGHDAIIVSGLDDLSPANIEIISEKYNIKTIVTRSAGINNIDIIFFRNYFNVCWT